MKNKHFGSWQGIVADAAIAIVIIRLGEVGVLGIAVKATNAALLQFFSKVNTGDLAEKKYEIPAFSNTKYLYKFLFKSTINFRLHFQNVVVTIIRNQQNKLGVYLSHKIACQTQELQALNKYKYNKMPVSNLSVIEFCFSHRFAKIVEEKIWNKKQKHLSV